MDVLRFGHVGFEKLCRLQGRCRGAWRSGERLDGQAETVVLSGWVAPHRKWPRVNQGSEKTARAELRDPARRECSGKAG